MSTEIEIIIDDGGVALIGDEKQLDRLLATSQLTSMPIDLSLLTPIVGKLGIAAQGGAEIAANAGRWLKLTEESAKALKLGNAMKGSTVDVARAVMTENGKISKILEFVKPGQLLSNPAVLTGVGGMMAQFAMQQAMEEITDYLARIEAKLGDVLQAQKDAQIAPLISAGLVIDEVMSVREKVGRVSETSWSKIQNMSGVLKTAQSYAILQVAAQAKKLAISSSIGESATVSLEIENSIDEWLAVIARAEQLSDALGVLELDRIFATDPAEIENHKQGLAIARAKRQEAIKTAIERLSNQLSFTAENANGKVLFNPRKTPKVINSSNAIAQSLNDFKSVIAIADTNSHFESRPWKSAAIEAKNQAFEKADDGLNMVKKVANETAENVARLAEGIKDEIDKKFHRDGKK